MATILAIFSHDGRVAQQQSQVHETSAGLPTVEPDPGPPTDWTASEQALWCAFQNGERLDLRDPDPTLNDPAKAGAWDAKRSIRASVVAQLLLNPPSIMPGHPVRFRVIGAHITGSLDLGCGIIPAFLFDHCRFDDAINVSDATANFIGIVGSSFPAFLAERVKCSGPIWLRDSQIASYVGLDGANITGELDLMMTKFEGRTPGARISLPGCSVGGDLRLQGSVIHGSIDLRRAEINGFLRLDGVTITNPRTTAVRAAKVRVSQSVRATGGFKCIGSVDMSGARIGGQLILEEANIINEKGVALNIDHAHIDLGLVAVGLVAKGQVFLHHAQVGCQVTFRAAKLSSAEERTVRADHLIVDGSLLINEKAEINGQIDLHGAEIKCTLNIKGVSVTAEKYPAFQADAIQVGGNVLGNGCHVNGGLDISDAKVGGSVTFSAATFERDGTAFDARRADISGSLNLNERFTCKGGAWLADASIGTSLDLSDAEFSNSGRRCLNAAGLRIRGDLLGDRVKVDGFFDLAGAQSTGDIRLADSELIGVPAQKSSLGSPVDRRKGGDWRGISLRMTAATVGGDIDLRAAKIGRSLVLRNAEISRSILLAGASLDAPEDCAFTAEGATAEALVLQLASKPAASIDLTATSVVTLSDSETSWPDSAPIMISGFRYQRLNSTLSPTDRLRWLTRAVASYSPQPYEQLASYYVANGDADQARRVNLESVRRSYRSRGFLGRIWGNIQDWSVGFGYAPSRAVLIFGALWLGSSIWFSIAVGPCMRFGVRWPSLCPVAAAGHLSWNPWFYSFDLLVPVVNLGWKTAWNPTGISRVIATAMTVAGWILTTTIIAAAGRRLRRQ